MKHFGINISFNQLETFSLIYGHFLGSRAHDSDAESKNGEISLSRFGWFSGDMPLKETLSNGEFRLIVAAKKDLHTFVGICSETNVHACTCQKKHSGKFVSYF